MGEEPAKESYQERTLTAGYIESGIIVEDAMLGGLFGSATFGFGGIVLGALLGFGGARLGKSFGEWGELAGGSLGATLAGYLFPLCPLAFLGKLRFWKIALPCFLFGFVLTGAFYHLLGQKIEGDFYSWAMAAAFPGILLGPPCQTMSIARGEEKLEGGARVRALLEWCLLLATIVKIFNRRLPGALFSGGVGGLLGGLFIGVLFSWRGGRDVAELIGGYFILPILGSVLGTIGGALGGWIAWQIGTGKMQPPRAF